MWGSSDPDLVVRVRGPVAFRPRLLKRNKNQCFLNPRLQKHSKTYGCSNLGRKAMKTQWEINVFVVAFRPRLLKRYKDQCFWHPRLQKQSKTNGVSNLGRKAMQKHGKTNAFLLLSDLGCSNAIKTNAFGTQGSNNIVKLLVLVTLVGKQSKNTWKPMLFCCFPTSVAQTH